MRNLFSVLLLVGLGAAAPSAFAATTVDVELLITDALPSGALANGANSRPTVSADGRFVAFQSDATNLVSGDTNFVADIFVLDRDTGVAERVSVDSFGVQADNSSGDPVISADGRYVTYHSTATNLVSGDTNGTRDIFVHDRDTGVTERVSVNTTGQEADAFSINPVISGDGRYVAFRSMATNLVPGDTNATDDIFVHDRNTGVTERVSVNGAGVEGNGLSISAAISADGRYVGFHSLADNLVPGDTNLAWDVFVHDRDTGTTSRINVSSGGVQANSNTFDPAFSDDGRYVAFESFASNLVFGDTNGASDIFIHDQDTGVTERVSVDSAGNQGNNNSFNPALSADGRFVVFRSDAGNLVAGDVNGEADVFVYDRTTGITLRVSEDATGIGGDGTSDMPEISADGSLITFDSHAANLDVRDTNGFLDVFVSNYVANELPVADAGPDQQLVCTGTTTPVTLDAGASFDPDDDTLTYQWTGAPDPDDVVDPALVLPVGAYSFDLIVNDGLNDSAADSVAILVEDPLAPAVSGLSDLLLEATSVDGADATLTPTVTDLCDASPTVTISPLGPYPLGATAVTVAAEDASGNAASQVVTVTVVDTTPPSLSVPGAVTAEATGMTTPVDIGTATASDIFTPVSVTNDAPAGGFPLGITPVTWTATDANGNTAEAVQQVTIVDTTPPALTVPADIVTTATGPTTPVDIGMASATDIFTPVSITNDAPAGGFPLGVTLVTWTATDPNGNSIAVVQSITVEAAPPTDGPKLVNGQLYDVGDGWQTVILPQSYVEPIVVATVQYDIALLPAVARVRNAVGDRFELRVQNPSGQVLTGGYRVHYVVVEAGVYTQAEHGVRMEAGKFVSTVTDGEINGWVGEQASYANSYDRPVVLGQVMSTNDNRWSVFWARGPRAHRPPTADALYLGKHIGEDPQTSRVDEELGYVVIESGSGSFSDGVYAAGVSPRVVGGTGNNPPYPVDHGLAMVSGGVAASAGLRGTDGGWPILYGPAPLAGSALDLAIDEDLITDGETRHTAERVGYLLFAPAPSDTGPNLVTGNLDDVGDSWLPVTLPYSYDDPVVVATVQYDNLLPPAVVRVRNAVDDGFELRVQNPSGATLSGGYRVFYAVVEAGIYTEAEHGVRMEAARFVSTRTDGRRNGWRGERVNYANSYDRPVVLGQVMSAADARWSVFWARGSRVFRSPGANHLYLGKHVGEDPSASRANEELGYLVIEAGSGVVDGLAYEAGVSPRVVTGTANNPPSSVPYGLGAVTAGFAAAAGISTLDGGWPILYGDTPFAGGELDLAIDEDQIRDFETWHPPERVGFLLID